MISKYINYLSPPIQISLPPFFFLIHIRSLLKHMSKLIEAIVEHIHIYEYSICKIAKWNETMEWQIARYGSDDESWMNVMIHDIHTFIHLSIYPSIHSNTNYKRWQNAVIVHIHIKLYTFTHTYTYPYNSYSGEQILNDIT